MNPRKNMTIIHYQVQMTLMTFSVSWFKGQDNQQFVIKHI